MRSIVAGRHAGIVRREAVPAAGGFFAVEGREDEITRFEEVAAFVGDHLDHDVEAFALAAAALLASVPGTANAQDTTSDRGKLSYALGYSTGQDIARMLKRGEQFDMATFMKAVEDAAAGKEPAVPREQLQAAVDNMQRRELARAKAEFDKVAADKIPLIYLVGGVASFVVGNHFLFFWRNDFVFLF